jgi:hypothetical protein
MGTEAAKVSIFESQNANRLVQNVCFELNTTSPLSRRLPLATIREVLGQPVPSAWTAIWHETKAWYYDDSRADSRKQKTSMTVANDRTIG